MNCQDLREQGQSGKHPCFSVGARHKYARMHLPVAPKCNISCNYCNRKYDCLHESRPGVTSQVLAPGEAVGKYLAVKEKIANLSVAGIAGPGDALANWVSCRETIRLIKEQDKEVSFCLSTNGLMLPQYAGEIVDLGVKYVTITINCLDPEIGAKIYRYVTYQGNKYTGAAGAAILIANQLEGLKQLVANKVVVKVNIVMIKGLNHTHIPEIVAKVKSLGAAMTNIMPLIPAPGSSFANYSQTSHQELNELRKECGQVLPQMYHCQQCRADAIGLLDEDRSIEFRSEVCSQQYPLDRKRERKKYLIAVASKNGQVIDQHFGHATQFSIYQGNENGFSLVEKRQVAKYCSGTEDCADRETVRDLAIRTIADCDMVLSLRIGYQAKERLRQSGIESLEHYDTIENSLHYAVQQLGQQEIS